MTWYDSDYGYKKKITIDHTKVGSDQIDFPIPISVTDADLADEGNGGHVKNSSGYDIIFTNDDEDTLLKHEIELYTNTNGTLVFWVKINSLSSTNDTDLYIYYGKTGVAADPSTTDTWDSNFKIVLHMNESAGATCNDSTSNGNDGTYQGSLPNQVSFGAGYGQDFNSGSTDYITLPKINLAAVGTFEAIAEFDAASNYEFLMGYRKDGNNLFSLRTINNDFDVLYYTNNVLQFRITPASDTNKNYHALVWATNDAELRKNDASMGTDNTVTTFSDVPTEAFCIGKNPGASSQYLNGQVDEIRFSDIRRSNSWLDTTYAAQNSPVTFMSWGAEEEGADTFAPSDTVNVSDDIIFKHKIFMPDTIDINDSILIKRLLSLSDTVDVNDSILFKRLLNLLDTIDVSDSVSFKHFLNLLDTVDIDDSASFKHLLNLLDTINVGDSVSFKRLLSLLDTIDVNDSVSFKHLISLLDTVDVSDSASFGNYNFLNLEDTVDVSDSVSFKHLISLLDNINVSDNFAYYSFTAELLKLYLFDAVNVNDSVSFKRLLNLLDTVAVSDAISFKHILNFIESVNIADSISFKHLLNLFDSIHVDDNVLYIKFDEKLYVYLSDLINIDDSVSFKHRINLDDNITIDEAIVVSYLLNLSDTIKIDDSVFGELVLSLQGDSYTVNLPMPQHGGESGSVDNELKLFNFWSDDIEVDTIGIDSEPITIQGVIKSWSDNANADMLIIATKFLNIHDMMKKREEITIKGLGGCFDAVYMIKNFSYNTVKNSPYEYTWNLSLEYVRAL